MSFHLEQQLKQGADPRGFADFAALKAELDKLHHPARPDVNWPYAEQLCVSLFKQNGVELQSAVWFCFIRTQQAGLAGMNEGLSLVHAMVGRQWSTFWPSQLPVRLELLAQLSQWLLQSLRGSQWAVADLRGLYEAGHFLDEICSVLEALEVKHLSQLERLQIFIGSAARHLEASGQATVGQLYPQQPASVGRVLPMTPPANPALVYVVTPEQQKCAAPAWHVKSLLGGLVFGAGLLAAGLWGWNQLQDATLQARLAPSFAALPAVLSEQQLAALDSKLLQSDSDWILDSTDRQLEHMAQQTATWPSDYSQQLLRQLEQLLPEHSQVASIRVGWYQQLERGALPEAELAAWRNGMDELTRLSQKLDALDEKRGQYMTVSQLKSDVFSIRQAFQKGVPLEERLYQLEEQRHKAALVPALQQQTDSHFQQLLHRYALIKEQGK